MHTVEQQAKKNSWPVVVEIDSVKLDFYPERHWVNCRCAQKPKTDESTPKWLDEITEGREFTAATSILSFDKENPEEVEYFSSLPTKYKRRTSVIWLTDFKLRKKESKFEDKLNKAPGFYTFKGLGCLTI